jgi:hypothetical protein
MTHDDASRRIVNVENAQRLVDRAKTLVTRAHVVTQESQALVAVARQLIAR